MHLVNIVECHCRWTQKWQVLDGALLQLHRTKLISCLTLFIILEIDSSLLFEACLGRQHTCDRLLKFAGMTMNMAPCVRSPRVELIAAQLFPILWGPIAD